ncbi:unnamed protein product [Linum trigynum]|uniref:Uncharacterized protein n=1 Tax=Linum trigynum TaxID=586398 RepID=A0AAV2FUD8_9ROSI
MMTIRKLIKDDGTTVIKVKEMGAVSAEFYQNLLGAEDTAVIEKPVEYYAAILQRKLRAEDVEELIAPVTRE